MKLCRPFGCPTLLGAPLLLLALCSMGEAQALVQEKQPEKIAPKSGPDPCNLLTSPDVEQVQGERVLDKKYSEQAGSSFLLRTCFYRTPTFAKSVSLALAVPTPADVAGKGPREFWEQHFRAPAPGLANHENTGAKPEEAEREPKRLAVSNVGEEAYWISDPHVGVLYVLEGNDFLRISLGNTGNGSLMLNKAESLARRTMQRLDLASR